MLSMEGLPRRAKKLSSTSQGTSGYDSDEMDVDEDDLPVDIVINKSQTPLTPRTQNIVGMGVKEVDLKFDPATGTYYSADRKRYRVIEVRSDGQKIFEPITPKEIKLPIITPDINTLKTLMPARYDPTEPRPESFDFTVTLNKMQEREERRISQNTLMGAPCKDIFKAHGINVEGKNHQFHWSHVRGLFVGGAHAGPNILPQTAQANLRTLHQVENFIAKKLLTGKVEKMDVRAEIEYKSNYSRIPINISYHVKWKENNQEHTRTVNINPRSQKSLNRKERKVLKSWEEKQSEKSPAVFDSLKMRLFEEKKENSIDEDKAPDPYSYLKPK